MAEIQDKEFIREHKKKEDYVANKPAPVPREAPTDRSQVD
ncbi:hypothetical protein RSAG8_06364, partial [Rhizoctonia solani AG-8 WAC10335]